MKIQFNQKLDSFLLLLGVYCLLTYFNAYAMEAPVNDNFKKVCTAIEQDREDMYKKEGWSIVRHYKEFLKISNDKAYEGWTSVASQSDITITLLDSMMQNLRLGENHSTIQKFIAYLSEKHYNNLTQVAHEALVDFLKKAFYYCSLKEYVSELTPEKIEQLPQDLQEMYKAIITHGKVESCFLDDTYREVFYRDISVAYGYMLGCASCLSGKVDTKKIEDELEAKDKSLAKMQEELISSKKPLDELQERLNNTEANQKKSKNELPIYLYGVTALSTVGFLTMAFLYFKK